MNFIEQCLFRTLYSTECRILMGYYDKDSEEKMRDYLQTVKDKHPELWEKYEIKYHIERAKFD